VGFPRLGSGQAHPTFRISLSDEERLSRGNEVSRGIPSNKFPARDLVSDEERLSRANEVSRGTPFPARAPHAAEAPQHGIQFEIVLSACRCCAGVQDRPQHGESCQGQVSSKQPPTEEQIAIKL